MLHLLFRVHGPLCSWGDIAPGTHRPTLAIPTRSAILGLVASALGIPRNAEDQHQNLSTGLSVGIRVECIGATLSDYHTVQTPSRERRAVWPTRRDELTCAATVNTILSTRDHVQDAAYTVALWDAGNGSTALSRIQAALEKPRFPPYLGRRACPPALPFAPQLIEAATLRQAFELVNFPSLDGAVLDRLRQAAGTTERRDSLRVEFDSHPSPGYEHVRYHTQRDQLTSSFRRTFRERTVYSAAHSVAEVS